MGRVEIVPRHLVHADCHHRLQLGIEPVGNEPAGDQLVDEKHRRVGEVEDERVPERLMPFVIRGIVADQRKEPIVEFAGLVVIPEYLRPLGGHRIAGCRIGGQQHRFRRHEWRGEGCEAGAVGGGNGGGRGRIHTRSC